jgi:hypothetical protein
MQSDEIPSIYPEVHFLLEGGADSPITGMDQVVRLLEVEKENLLSRMFSQSSK